MTNDSEEWRPTHVYLQGVNDTVEVATKRNLFGGECEESCCAFRRAAKEEGDRT